MSDFDQMVRKAIVAHYMGQRGSGASAYPVFRGAPVQYGNGIGDIFRSLGRFLFPIFATTAKTFVQSAAQGLSQGQSLKEAAKGAFKPTLTSTVQDATERVYKKLTGGGRKRKPRGSKKRKPKAKKGGLYKGAKKAKRSRKTVPKFSPINF